MKSKETARTRRHVRLRKKVMGAAERPRLSFNKSLNNLYAQVIDDSTGRTLVALSTLDPSLRAEPGHKGNVATAKKVGQAVAAKAVASGVTKVVFDRCGFRYHGCVKAFAEGAREGGLEF